MSTTIKRGDLVLKRGLFGNKMRIVNRVFEICEGTMFLLDDTLWEREEHMVRHCKISPTYGWEKI